MRLADTRGAKMDGKMMVEEKCWPQKSSEMSVYNTAQRLAGHGCGSFKNHLTEGWQGSQSDDPGEVNLLQ